MIELIFVIVIIGILAAVAIPKLSATRDDAKISNIIANSRTFIGDLGQYYTAQGQSVWDANGSVTAATNVNLFGSGCSALDVNSTVISPNTFELCDGTTTCIQFRTANGGQLTIDTSVVTVGASAVCDGVIGDPTIKGIVGLSQVKVQNFGGSRVKR
jgi:type II secretory pathway pseudopilin PulG